MMKRWLEMQLTVPADAVDLVTLLLTELGCTGVIAAERQLDSFVVPDPLQLANAPVLRAFFPYPASVSAFEETVRSELANVLPAMGLSALPEINCRELADEDWASNWQQHFPPFKVGTRLVICPSWETWAATGDEVVLTLDPGQAFGTGTHATTSLCLDAVADCYATVDAPRQVLDVGTGSGILAMAAAVLGAEQVTACDIDVEACQVARSNVAQNGLDAIVSISSRPLDQIPGHYGLVLANILAAENIRLSQELVDHLAPDGVLVLSGILAEQEPQVKEGFARFPLRLEASRYRDEWVCMIYRRYE